jgi:hypothetical protein
MKVETALVQRALIDGDMDANEHVQPSWTLQGEIRAWGRLFHDKYRPRTMIGILIMVFQRMCFFWTGLSGTDIGFTQNGVESMLYSTMDQPLLEVLGYRVIL